MQKLLQQLRHHGLNVVQVLKAGIRADGEEQRPVLVLTENPAAGQGLNRPVGVHPGDPSGYQAVLKDVHRGDPFFCVLPQTGGQVAGESTAEAGRPSPDEQERG